MSSDGEEVDEGTDLAETEKAAFRRLLETLQSDYGFDFREYKTLSLLRRIRARMAHVRVGGFDTYVEYLRLHGQEATALFSSILINVTGFYRDTEAWDALRAEALPPLIAGAAATGRLRVWSPGCSTGEETYSAAMLIADALGARATDVEVKIYATDVDDEVLVGARGALFRADQLRDVPADALRRHFTADGHLFRVRRELRRWCIFGRHNVAQDPPLRHIDLLICRNLLIYFKSSLQERLLSRFYYSLREGGVLFLGRSESLAARAPGFVPISQKWRLFRRARDRAMPSEASAPPQEVATEADGRSVPPSADDTSRITRSGIFRSLPYPAILVGLDDSVLEWNEAATALFEIPTANALGRQFRDLDISYRAEGLRARVEGVKRAVGGSRLENVMLTRRSGETLHVDFWVTRVYGERSLAAGILVAAWDGTAVARLREELVRLAEQHATATEELQSTNEELETTNEELQSTNEELETTNEELQSTNEELVTTVDELQAVNEELAVRSSELKRLSLYHASVVDSVSDAIVVLDKDFTVTSWNPAAERLLGVAATLAIGRDFFALSIGTPVPTLRAALARIGSGEAPEASGVVEFEVPRIEGERRAAVMRFMPLVDADGAPQGFLGLGRAT